MTDQVIKGGIAVVTERTQKSDLRRGAHRYRLRVTYLQIALLLLLLGSWEVLTRIPWFVENTIYDPFFISQPSRIFHRLYEWTLGDKAGFLWPHLTSTLSATLIGLVIAVVSGFVVGLVLSQNRFLADVLSPFIVAFNSLPRIAFVPLITMLFGLGLASKVATAWFVVFFLVFFNTYKGSLSIERELIDFCRTLGGNRRQIMMAVRVPIALAWAFASLPNAVSFSLIAVVVTEFVGSTTGMGYVMNMSLSTLQSTDMFAAIIVLSVAGVALVFSFRGIERRVLHWSAEFREAN